MSLSTTNSLDDVRTRLAHALGYHDYPATATAKPYLTYIYKSHIGNGRLEEWLELFIEIIEHFDVKMKQSGGGDSIQALIDRLASSGFHDIFSDTSPGHPARVKHVEDTVMYILGIWTTMLSSFVQQRNQVRKVTAAYKTCSNGKVSPIEPYDENVAGLISGCELLPGGRWDYRPEFGKDAATKLMMLICNSLNIPSSPTHMSLQSVDPHAFGGQASLGK
jgi:hypothetical protein